jgi:hypothetical protein
MDGRDHVVEAFQNALAFEVDRAVREDVRFDPLEQPEPAAVRIVPRIDLFVLLRDPVGGQPARVRRVARVIGMPR